VVESEKATLGLTMILLPATLILTPPIGAGKTLRFLSTFCGLTHSEKLKTISLFFGTFTVPAGGAAESTAGGFLSSGPPEGGIWWAQDKYIIIEDEIMTVKKSFIAFM
jgi:hypothetical protein